MARLLMRAGANSDALDLLEAGYAAQPASGPIALLLANASAEAGRHARALEILTPLAETARPDAALVARVAELNQRFGRIDESLRFHRKAAALDRSRVRGFIAALAAAGRRDDALHEARAILFRAEADPALRFACYGAVERFSKDAAEIAGARRWLIESLPAGAGGAVWRARLYKLEDDFERALEELNTALAADPADAELLRERASVALALGYWGRDARILSDAREVLHDAPELRTRMAQADALFAALGGSVEQAADDERFSRVTTPESVFELVARTAPEPAEAGGTGLAMIAHSLTAGGAERVVADTFRRLSESGRFDWVKLYLVDLSPANGTDFYLPLTGPAAKDIVLLDRHGAVETPFSFLPLDGARTAQAIFNRLREDRPAIVHVSLEPLTLFAGLAALAAGVPRIVLHTHNMRPTVLRPDLAAPRRWRGCYRALLSRREVALVGCAEAAMRDYAQWLDVPYSDNMRAVHNSFDATRFRPLDNAAQRLRLRVALGLPRDAPVVGTAFKFREEKRPLFWVDAACRVLERKPDCRFVMFGDGELMEPTRRYIEAKGAAGRFLLPGLVADIETKLPALDLFLLTSTSEALPNVLLEAQACGVPVIARHVGGVAETMIGGTSGILVEKDDAGAVADAVLRALDNPFWHRAAAAAGRDFVRKRFTPERMIDGLCDVLLSRKAARA